MLLITMNEWLGPSRKMSIEIFNKTQATERLVSLATRLDLGYAIEKIHEYEERYNKKYPTCINFRLLHVAKIEELSNEQLQMCRVDLVENLIENLKQTNL